MPTSQVDSAEFPEKEPRSLERGEKGLLDEVLRRGEVRKRSIAYRKR